MASTMTIPCATRLPRLVEPTASSHRPPANDVLKQAVSLEIPEAAPMKFSAMTNRDVSVIRNTHILELYKRESRALSSAPTRCSTHSLESFQNTKEERMVAGQRSPQCSDHCLVTISSLA